MKRFFAFVCLGIIAFSLAVIGFAHPGGTDGSGGHYNRSTGEYHYHHGYPEHQHTNGECPYNFKDNTEHKDNTDNKNFRFSDSSTEYFFVIIGISLALVVIFFSVRRFYINKKSRKYAGILKTDLAKLKSKQAAIEENAISKINNELLNKKNKEEYIDECYKVIATINSKLYYEYFLGNIDDIPYSGFPEGVELRDGKLADTHLPNEKYGRFTFYKTPNGSVIHLVRGCSNAYQPYHMIYNTYGIRNAPLCKRCGNNSTRDKLYFFHNHKIWYQKYDELQRLRQEYDIPQKPLEQTEKNVAPKPSAKTYSIHEGDTWICNIRG